MLSSQLKMNLTAIAMKSGFVIHEDLGFNLKKAKCKSR